MSDKRIDDMVVESAPMMTFDETFEGQPNFNIKVRKLDDGNFEASSASVSTKSYVAESEELAVRAFRVDLDANYSKLLRGESW